MRKHVTPAHPDALIPDPILGDRLPPEGRDVVWSAYWAGLLARKDITSADVAAPAPAEPVPAELAPAEPVPAEPDVGADHSA